MSPAYRTQEQYDRWHVGECVRCGRRAAKAANWEGLICRTCCEKAARVQGVCPGCGVQRLLPGRRDGAPACRDCTRLVVGGQVTAASRRVLGGTREVSGRSVPGVRIRRHG